VSGVRGDVESAAGDGQRAAAVREHGAAELVGEPGTEVQGGVPDRAGGDQAQDARALGQLVEHARVGLERYLGADVDGDGRVRGFARKGGDRAEQGRVGHAFDVHDQVVSGAGAAQRVLVLAEQFHGPTAVRAAAAGSSGGPSGTSPRTAPGRTTGFAWP